MPKSFSDILKKGKDIFEVKDGRGVWGRCEDCGQRKILYEYFDKEKQCWMLCENCITRFIGEDNERK